MSETPPSTPESPGPTGSRVPGRALVVVLGLLTVVVLGAVVSLAPPRARRGTGR